MNDTATVLLLIALQQGLFALGWWVTGRWLGLTRLVALQWAGAALAFAAGLGLILQRGALLQKISLVSGLILFLFAALHFSNHALGLISLDTMVTFQEWRLLITRSIPGTIVLLAALMFHMGHGLYKLAGRSTFRLPAWEIARVAPVRSKAASLNDTPRDTDLVGGDEPWYCWSSSTMAGFLS